MLTPGDPFGDYRVLNVMGEGPLRVVYLAEQRDSHGRQVALTVAGPHASCRDVIGRFEATRPLLLGLEHPNIARVLAGGRSPSGRAYLVTEFVDGVSIMTYCDQRCLSVRERLELFLPVCHAVQHAHQSGLVHRGLRPSSILVTAHAGRPRPKIIDFGLGPATASPYTSPEQIERTGLDIDARTDVYSLGVTLYEILLGVPPFDESDLQGLGALYAVLEREPPALNRRYEGLGVQRVDIAARRGTDASQFLKQLTGDLAWITLKAMQKDRSRRYGTVAGLSMDLQRHLSGKPVEAHPRTAGYRFGKFVRRHRTATVVAVSGALIVTSILLAYLTL